MYIYTESEKQPKKYEKIFVNMFRKGANFQNM